MKRKILLVFEPKKSFCELSVVNLACGRGSLSEYWSRMNILQESFLRDNGGGIAKPTCCCTNAVPKREQFAKKPKISEPNRTSDRSGVMANCFVSYGGAYTEKPHLSWEPCSPGTQIHGTRMSMLPLSSRGLIKGWFSGSFDYQYESPKKLVG
ncbi:unnamed protein product [Sphenostylis stenocarpa]|uniref:Uncharacterized protein n=1 Tax=Sphenostylis stenocarpa TaxID=92480 RepID=A0AA86VG97_9FABA|nr:unnamed protein product [Sphenostylis stenocarpa]